jgi:hypothetical protein
MIHRGVEEKSLGSLACGFFILITSCAVWGASLGLKSKVCARRRAARKPLSTHMLFRLAAVLAGKVALAVIFKMAGVILSR